MVSPLTVWGIVYPFYPKSLDSRTDAIFTNLSCGAAIENTTFERHVI